MVGFPLILRLKRNCRLLSSQAAQGRKRPPVCWVKLHWREKNRKFYLEGCLFGPSPPSCPFLSTCKIIRTSRGSSAHTACLATAPSPCIAPSPTIFIPSGLPICMARGRGMPPSVPNNRQSRAGIAPYARQLLELELLQRLSLDLHTMYVSANSQRNSSHSQETAYTYHFHSTGLVPLQEASLAKPPSLFLICPKVPSLSSQTRETGKARFRGAGKIRVCRADAPGHEIAIRKCHVGTSVHGTRDTRIVRCHKEADR